MAAASWVRAGHASNSVARVPKHAARFIRPPALCLPLSEATTVAPRISMGGAAEAAGRLPLSPVEPHAVFQADAVASETFCTNWRSNSRFSLGASETEEWVKWLAWIPLPHMRAPIQF